MVYCIDIDGTICNVVAEADYGASKPYVSRVEHVNRLYDAGHTIILWTGRHWNHLSVTRKQLFTWGVKYHALIMAKPVADVYIDDRAMNDTNFFGEINA